MAMKLNLNFKEIFSKLSKSKSLKYGSYSIIMTAIVVALAIVANLLVDLTELKWDLTPEKLYSIGDETFKILDSLDKDIEIIGLFDDSKINDNVDLKEIDEMLNQYEKRSDRIKVKYIDPDKNPGIYKELDPDELKNISAYDFVVRCGNKIKVVKYYDMFEYTYSSDYLNRYVTGSKIEPAVTGAIKYVTAEYTPAIYFLSGHSERSLDSEYTIVKEFLDRNNFEVKELNLLTEDKVPDNAEIVVVISPQKDLSAAEREKLMDYLDNGGHAIMIFDPISQDPDLTYFQSILEGYGVSLNYDIVNENEQYMYYPNSPTALIPSIKSTDISSDLVNAGIPLLFPDSRSINILKNTKEYIEVTPVIVTSDKATGRLIDSSRGADVPGPLNIAVMVEDKGGYEVSKLVVFGDGDFLTDSMIESFTQGGIYLFLTTVQWMSDKQDNDVLIRPKKYEVRRLDNINQLQANMLAAVVTIVLPLLILGTGIFVWVRRRHL